MGIGPCLCGDTSCSSCGGGIDLQAEAAEEQLLDSLSEQKATANEYDVLRGLAVTVIEVIRRPTIRGWLKVAWRVAGKIREHRLRERKEAAAVALMDNWEPFPEQPGLSLSSADVMSPTYGAIEVRSGDCICSWCMQVFRQTQTPPPHGGRWDVGSGELQVRCAGSPVIDDYCNCFHCGKMFVGHEKVPDHPCFDGWKHERCPGVEPAAVTDVVWCESCGSDVAECLGCV